MTFGSSCEQSEESSPRKQNRQRRERKKEELAQLDPFDRVVALCAVRDRSCVELHERLEKEGYDSAKTEQAIARAVDCGLVDDLRFADSFVRGRVSSGKGASGILRDLSAHGIDPASLEAWPEGYGLDDESQVERAVAYLHEHPPRAKDAWAAAYRKLLSRGYSQGLASKSTRIWAESRTP